MKKLLLFLCLIAAPRMYAADITATACSVAALKAAVESAPADSTVVMPAGSSTETAGVSVTVSAKNVKVVGGDKCTITDDINRTGFDAGMLEFTVLADGFDMSGMNFKWSGNQAALTYNGSVRIFGTGKFRIHHNAFDNVCRTSLLVAGPYGLVDQNKANMQCGYFIRVNGVGEGDAAWAEDTGFGTDRAVYVEKNTIICDPYSGGVNDSYKGGRLVIRDNDFDGCGTQTHPTGGSYRSRGTRLIEIYRNIFRNTHPTECAFNGFFYSSGSSVFWGNTFSGCWSNMISMHSMRVKGSSVYGQVDPPGGWGYCPSIYDIDGCFDHPGRAKSDLLSGDFPNVKNDTKGCMVSATCTVDQVKEVFYEWDNVWVNPGMGGSKVSVYDATLLAGRDYIANTPRPGYAPLGAHPLATGGGTTPIPPVDPVPPVVNVAPTVTLTFDPVLPTGNVITVKNQKLVLKMADDTGIVWTELYINTQKVWEGDEASQKTYTWNTAPWRNKGAVTIKVVTYDADHASATVSQTVTVKK